MLILYMHSFKLHLGHILTRMFEWGGDSGDHNVFLYKYSIWVKKRLHTENQLARLPGINIKVYAVGLKKHY